MKQCINARENSEKFHNILFLNNLYISLKSFFIIAIILSLNLLSYSQSVRSISLGNPSVINNGDALDAKTNPANISDISINKLSFSSTPFRFGLSELATYEISYNKSFQIASFGLRSTMFGFELYKEITLGLTVTKKIYDVLILGTNINYNHLNIKNYGNDACISFDFGINYKLSNYFYIGLSYLNINGAKYGSDLLEQKINLGVICKALDNLSFFGGLENTNYNRVNKIISLEYNINSMITFRSGINTEPEMFFSGFGIVYKYFIFDYAFSFHNILGFSHSFSLGYNFDF